ncbi:Histidyl-tRNA synthetase, partial [Candidatus Regiella insecticola 5.15]
AEDLRNKIPSLKLMTHHGGGKIARQFSRAEQCGARFALVLGSNELSTRKVTLKNLATGEQETLQQADIAVHLAKLLT